MSELGWQAHRVQADRRGLVRMFWARRDASAVNYCFRACLVANLDPNTRARHGVLGAGRAMELAHLKWGATLWQSLLSRLTRYY